MFQGEKMLMTSRIANRPKPRFKKPDNHNERERCRRSRLKLELERVRELLPAHNKSKRPATKTILDSAANYCLFLTARLKSLMRMRNQEKTRRKIFAHKLLKHLFIVTELDIGQGLKYTNILANRYATISLFLGCLLVGQLTIYSQNQGFLINFRILTSRSYNL